MDAKVPSEMQWVPASHWAPQLRAPVPRRGVPTTAGCENQGLHLVRQRATLDLGILLNGPSTDSLPHKHSAEALEKGQQLWTNREELNCLASGRRLEGQLSPRLKCQ